MSNNHNTTGPTRSCQNCGFTGIQPNTRACPECGANPHPISPVGWIIGIGCLGLLVTLLGGFLTCAEGIAGGLAPGEPNRYLPVFWIGVGLIALVAVVALWRDLRARMHKNQRPKRQ